MSPISIVTRLRVDPMTKEVRGSSEADVFLLSFTAGQSLGSTQPVV
jgi:hypothetical protein